MSTFDAPESVRLGKCKLIEEVMIGEDKLIKFSGMFALRFHCNIILGLLLVSFLTSKYQ